MMNSKIDDYLRDGCGRCSLYATPECKVHKWNSELVLLRELLIECGLTEELKWSQPCYTDREKNIIILSAFKEFCSLNFVKGALLNDPENWLVKAGENSHIGRLMKFTNPQQVTDNKDVIKSFIFEAIEAERAGLAVPSKPVEAYDLPEELVQFFEEDPAFHEAFYALTPGRQKGYILHFSGAKQAKTRISRIEKYIPHIFAGKGFHDR